MNITWHIIRKDLSRFWLGILFLVGLVALKIVLITGIFSAEVTREWAGRMMRYQSLLLISQWFLSYFVAVAVVHEDPVSEPGAFWATLPISRRQLLGAKLLGVIIICALPVLLTLAMGWIAVGLPINLLGWPLTVVAEAQLGLCLLAFAFASLTKNTAHLIFWMIGVTLTPFIPVIFPELFRHGQGVLTPGARFTRLFMANLIWVVTAVAVMLNQYLGQSRKRSIVFLALGLGLGVYAATFPFSGALLPGQHRLDNEIAGLSADITQAVLAKPKPDADATSLIRISLKQILPNLVIYPYYVVWSQSGADRQPAKGRIYQSDESPVEQAVIHALGFASPSSIRSVDFGVESIVPAAEVTRLAGRTTPYNILVALDVRNFAIEGQMELAQGAVLRTVLGEDKITSVRFDGSIMRVEIEGRDSGLNSGPGWFVGINAEFEPLSDIVYVLVNKKTKTVLMPSRTSTGMGANAYCISPIRGSLQFVLPPSNNAAPAATEWQLVKIRLGNRHRAIKSFTANMSLKEIPKIEMDPEWFIER